MWFNRDDKTFIYNNDQLKSKLISSPKRIFFIDGPSGCGKTFFLKQMKPEGVYISPFCVVLEELLEYLKLRLSILNDSNIFFN